MPEIGETSVEVAHHLGHGGAHNQPHSRLHGILEIVEAIVLALVAITTAWSGYQAALWDGHQSLLYGQSTKLRVQAQGLEVQSNQEQMYDAATVVEWLKAAGARRYQYSPTCLSDACCPNSALHLRRGRRPTQSTTRMRPLAR